MRKKMIVNLCILLIIVCSIGFFSYRNQANVTLTFGMFSGSYWDVPNGDTYAIIDDVIERFEKEHENVKVKYISGIQKRDYSEWISQRALTGDMPDVFMVLPSDMSTFANIGMLENLDGYMKKDKQFSKGDYFTPSFASGAYASHQYALPYETVPTFMYVNKTLLKKEGIELPDKDWTWEEFYKICEKVTGDKNGNGKIDQFGVYGYSWQNAIASNGATVFNKEGTSAMLDNAKVYEALNFVRRLDKINEGSNITSEMFDKGQIAFCPMRFSEYRTYKPYPWRVKKYSNFEWDCIPMPSGPAGNNASQVDTLSMGMSAKSKHKQLAWEFLKMLSYNTQTQLNIFDKSQGVSVLKKVTASKEAKEILIKDTPGESNFTLDFLNDVMEEAITNNQFTAYEQVMSVADSEIRRLMNTDEDIVMAMNTLQSKLNVILQK